MANTYLRLRDVTCGKNCSTCKKGTHGTYLVLGYYKEGIRKEKSLGKVTQESDVSLLILKAKDFLSTTKAQTLTVERKDFEKLNFFPQQTTSSPTVERNNSWVDELVGENIGERQPWSETYDLEIPEVNFAPRNDVPLNHPYGTLAWKDGEFYLKKEVKETG